jgi:methylmalonyl-CoA/ethylmalonyl-CoA epimerase
MTMSDELQRRLELPPARQVGFVVPDLEAALALYEPLFGAFQRMDTNVEAATYRGEERDCRLKMATAKSGELEIELIEFVDGESPHREFLDRGGNGMHHLCFRVGNDLDKTIGQAKVLGYECIWYKRLNEWVAFAYLERKDDPLVIELLQVPG